MKLSNSFFTNLKGLGMLALLLIMTFPADAELKHDYYNLNLSEEVQLATITGTVTDKDGEPLVGVSILRRGPEAGTYGTVTDVDGTYSIEADQGDILVFSYTGMVTREVEVGTQTVIDVELAEDANLLDEVVVVGYGTRKKSHNTGAISQVGGSDIAAIQANRVDDALGGKLAGVLIQTQDGAPGADPKIQIRAASSISGDSNPLIVVDGYPISGSLATVNPNDIESLEVLKDAASAAIYGSRGANGVILVTT
ncbi:MAG: TonB-dependent receptor plug domain-containing protein, partial [Bacteroidota bacterium]